MKSIYIQLAPMEGVLDWILRELLSEVGGVDHMVTEFVRVTDQVLPESVFRKYAPELERDGCTRSGIPVFVQLLGGQPEPMGENAAVAVRMGALGIDLNFGCPAKTVNRHDGGAALLKNPERVFHVTRAVRKAVPLNVPVTVKVRLGFEHKDFHREIALAAAESGAAQLVVHARTKVEMYTPPAHWSFIKNMRDEVASSDMRMVANGEVWSADDYARCNQDSGVENVALGRGLVARPTLALDIRGLPAGNYNQIEFLHRFFDMSFEFKGAAFAVARMKQLLRYQSREDKRATLWFDEVKRMIDVSQLRDFLTRLRALEQN